MVRPHAVERGATARSPPCRSTRAISCEQWRAELFDESWRVPSLYALGHIDRVPDVPILIMSSWYDPYPRTATDDFMALRRGGRRSPLWLVMGPWLHGRRSDSHSGDAEFGPDATLDGALAADYTAFRLAFFEAAFKPQAGDTAGEPVVRYFRMGGGSGRRDANGRILHGGAWMKADDWPLPAAIPTAYHLNADGSLSTARQTAHKASRTWDFDPANPVPSIGGTITSGEPIMVGGGFDQREDARFFGCKPPYGPLAERADVLVFETEPLIADVEVTGAVSARLYVAVSTPDTDLTIKLIDVYPPSQDYPDGFAMNIADGIQRLKFSNGYERAELLVPGEVVQVEVHAFPTSNLFKAGHRIRLDVSS